MRKREINNKEDGIYLYMSLDFGTRLLDDGPIDGASEVGVLISDGASLVSDLVENILANVRRLDFAVRELCLT